MARFALLVAALVAPFAFAVPTPGNSYSTGGSAPAGYNASVENFCTVPDALYCCTQVVGGIAGEPDATATGCTNAMAGGQITYEFGYCPMAKMPLCCAVAGAAGVNTGCGLPIQVPEPKN